MRYITLLFKILIYGSLSVNLVRFYKQTIFCYNLVKLKYSQKNVNTNCNLR